MPTPLKSGLRNGGISFGGVVAVIFADLIIIPILLMYRKCYGIKMVLVILGVFYATMVFAGYAVELLFGAAGLVPATRNAAADLHPSITWDYTTILNVVVFFVFFLAAALVWRFFRTGGRQMLKMMGGAPGRSRRRGARPPLKRRGLAAFTSDRVVGPARSSWSRLWAGILRRHGLAGRCQVATTISRFAS